VKCPTCGGPLYFGEKLIDGSQSVLCDNRHLFYVKPEAQA